jgi:hypothetical protein
MIMDRQNQYCENGYIANINIHIQCNPHQNSSQRLKKINPKVHIEAKNLQIAKAILSEKSNAGGSTIP